MGAMREKLLDYRQLSEATNRPVRTLRDWAYKGKIPFLRVGHRTILFEASKVFEALERFEVKAATDRVERRRK